MWWVYLADRKTNTMILPPEKVVGLVDSKEVRLLSLLAGLFCCTFVEFTSGPMIFSLLKLVYTNK